MRKQQVHPAPVVQVRQSQHAWSIAPQAGSPLVQVTHTPRSVYSNLHTPTVGAKAQTVIPLHSTHQLHIPPASIRQRLCTMLAATLSSQVQVTLKPPADFSTLNVQRGTIIQLVPAVTPVGVAN